MTESVLLRPYDTLVLKAGPEGTTDDTTSGTTTVRSTTTADGQSTPEGQASTTVGSTVSTAGDFLKICR